MKVRDLSTDFNENYSIEEDAFCHWWLIGYCVKIGNSPTPYPLFEHALKQNWITLREAMEVASKLNLKFEFIEVK